MTDIASLGVAIDATSADTAASALDRFAASGARAEASSERMQASAGAALGAFGAVAGAADQVEAALGGVASSQATVEAATGRAASAAQEMAAAIAAEEAALLAAARAANVLAADTNQVAAAMAAAVPDAQALALSFDDIYDAAQRDFAGQYVAQLNAAERAHDQFSGAAARGSRAMRLTTHEAANLGRQFSDIGVMLASGQNPMMTLIQQGPQVADVFATAGARGVGFRAVLASIGAMAAPLLPAILGIGAAVGTVAGLFAAGAQQINRNAGDITKGLGLTEDQMKRLEKSGTTMAVTMGDTIGATFEVLGERIWNAIGPTMTEVGGVIADFYQDTVDGAVWFAKETAGVFTGAFGAIKSVWSMLPGALGDVVIQTANVVLEAVEAMVNKAIGLINVVTDAANNAAWLQGYRGPLIPKLGEVSIDPLDNPFRGMARDTMSAAVEAFEAERETGRQAIGDLLADIQTEAIENARDRIRKAAGDPRKQGRTRTSDTERALRQATEAAEAAERELAVQVRLNDAVASGAMSSAEANRQREIAGRLAPLEVEADRATGAEKAALLAVVERLRDAYEGLDRAQQAAAVLEQNEAQERAIILMEKEVGLIGELERTRAVALARAQAEQDLAARGIDVTTLGGAEQAAYEQAIENAGRLAGLQSDLRLGQELYNAALEATSERLIQIDDLVGKTGDSLANALDGISERGARAVQALTDIASALTGLAVVEERVNRDRTQAWKAVLEAIESGNPILTGAAFKNLGEVGERSAREMADAQVGAYASMAGAAKNFFDQGTAGYKVLEAAEIAFRTVQFAMSLRAMVQDAAETAASSTNSLSRAVSSTIAGAAKAFEQLGVWGFIGAGAILAFMGALGVNAGGSSGGRPREPQDAEGRQERQGTGSVLGSAMAKSDSIARSLDLVAAHTNDQLEYSNAMLRALRNIESNIGNLAAAVARSMTAGGALDTSGVRERSIETNNGFWNGGFNNPITALGVGGGPDPLGLFNTTVSRKLLDAGIRFANQSLSEILTAGVDAQAYQTVQTTTTQKILGLFSTSKAKNKTTTSDIDPELARQFGLVIDSLRTGVLEAAAVLGVEGAGAVLDAFEVNLGSISFKDMDADEITATLNAVFSKLGDDMAAAAVPGLTAVQKAGEGLFETLMRVAREYQVIDVTLASIGKTFGQVGLESIEARQRMLDLFGGLDIFTEQVGFYADNFLTEAERLAPIRAAVEREFQRLGIAGLDTRDEFKALVDGLDLTTEAGAEMFAALMALAPAFAAITEETREIVDARDALADAYSRESAALVDTADRFRTLAGSLGRFRESLYSGPTAALTPEQQYLAARAEFERISGLAAQGNEEALGDLQNVSQAYLDASRAYYASSAGYFADLEAVRAAVTAAEGIAGEQVDLAEAQLDQLRAMVEGVLDLNETQLTVVEALAQLNALLAAALGAGGDTPVVITPSGELSQTTTPTAPSPPAPPPAPSVDLGAGGTGGTAGNDNTDLITEVQMLRAEVRALQDELRAANQQRGAVAAAQLAQGKLQLEVLDQTVTALRAQA